MSKSYKAVIFALMTIALAWTVIATAKGNILPMVMTTQYTTARGAGTGDTFRIPKEVMTASPWDGAIRAALLLALAISYWSFLCQIVDSPGLRWTLFIASILLAWPAAYIILFLIFF